VLSPRAETILLSVVNKYIEYGTPVSSQSLVSDGALAVSSATIRNEMALLEQEGYIVRPHTSAGSVPSDKAYRFYVASLNKTPLPLSEQRLISHIFHQVEGKLEQWLSLAAAIMAQLTKNVAIVTIPKPTDCRFRHLEAVVLQGSLVLVILVLRGARVKQLLATLGSSVSQDELTRFADSLCASFTGLTADQISEKKSYLSQIEQQLADCVLEMMREEDEQDYSQAYLEGIQFVLSHPEFLRSQHRADLIELLQNRSLLLTVLPQELDIREVQVVIGSENKLEAVRDCGVVVSRYGLPNEAVGTISVIGPTRMPYAHIMPAVGYLSSVLSSLVGELYGIRYESPNSN